MVSLDFWRKPMAASAQLSMTSCEGTPFQQQQGAQFACQDVQSLSASLPKGVA